MTKIRSIRPLDRWCRRASLASSAAAGLGLLMLPLIDTGDPPMYRHRDRPGKVAVHTLPGSVTTPEKKPENKPESLQVATAPMGSSEPTIAGRVERPVERARDTPQASAPPERIVSPSPAPELASPGGSGRSFPAPVAKPIGVALPAAAFASAAGTRPAPGDPMSADAVPAAAASAVVTENSTMMPPPKPEKTGSAPALSAALVSAASHGTGPAQVEATRVKPPHLAEPPAIADPSVPSPAAPLPPDSWTSAEIEAAQQECATLLGPLDAEVEHVEAFRTGLCGVPAPVKLQRLGISRKVELQPAVLTNCRVVAGLSDWVEETLQPAAQEAFGSPVARIIGASSYSCRNRYNNPGQRISEHAFANAIDIAGFVLADGRRIDVKSNWGPTARDIKAEAKALADAAKDATGKTPAGDKSARAAASTPPITTSDTKPSKAALERRTAWNPAGLQKLGAPPAKDALPIMPSGGTAPSRTVASAESRFLHRLHSGACQIFGTVLGPEANDAHRDHFHLDMKDRRKTAFCE